MAMFMPQLREAIMPLHDEAEKRGPLREIPEKTMTLNNYKKDSWPTLWICVCV